MRLLNAVQVVGLLFSGAWSPQCRDFTAKLAALYTAVNAAKPNELEVVYLSSDRNEKTFEKAIADMPWLALPYDETDVKDRIYDKFKVYDMPVLILLRRDGGVITNEGVSLVARDPQGQRACNGAIVLVHLRRNVVFMIECAVLVGVQRVAAAWIVSSRSSLIRCHVLAL